MKPLSGISARVYMSILLWSCAAIVCLLAVFLVLYLLLDCPWGSASVNLVLATTVFSFLVMAASGGLLRQRSGEEWSAGYTTTTGMTIPYPIVDQKSGAVLWDPSEGRISGRELRERRRLRRGLPK